MDCEIPRAPRAPLGGSRAVALIVLVVLATAGFAAWRYLFVAPAGADTSRLEQWCGRQVRLIVGDLLNPTLEFDRLTFRLPGEVTISGIRLIDGDVTCLEADAMRIELREVPRWGEPIIIDTVELSRPTVRLVRGPDGGLAGFSNLVRSNGGRRAEDGGSSRPSDVFAIRRIAIDAGGLEWTGVDGNVMAIDELHFELDGAPRETPGLYELDITLDRLPVLALVLRGRLGLDDAVLELDRLELRTTLDESTKSTLPPPVQSALSARDVRGELTIEGIGRIPLDDATNGSFEGRFELLDAFYRGEAIQLPIRSIGSNLALRDGRFEATSLEASVFDGRLDGQLGVEVAGDRLMDLTLVGDGLRLESMLRAAASEGTPYAGEVSIDGRAHGPLALLPEYLGGGGRISVRDGTLMGDPVFGTLMRAIGRSKSEGTDRGETHFTLHPDRVELKDLEIVGGTMAARGWGAVFYDGRLDLALNGGPLERAQEALGPIGEAIGRLTDQLMTYRVTGTWSDVSVNVEPLGIGAGG